jgi:hypothetical protein
MRTDRLGRNFFPHFLNLSSLLRRRKCKVAYRTQLSVPNNRKDLGFEVLTAVVMKSSIFWDITQCSPLKFSRRSFETSIDFQRTTGRYISEDRTLNKIIYLHRTQSFLIFIGAEIFKKLASFMEPRIPVPSWNDKSFIVNKFNVNNTTIYIALFIWSCK